MIPLFKNSWQQAFQLTAARRRLDNYYCNRHQNRCFNSQPPEGGWVLDWIRLAQAQVSTHSRPKAAGVSSVFTSFR